MPHYIIDQIRNEPCSCCNCGRVLSCVVWLRLINGKGKALTAPSPYGVICAARILGIKDVPDNRIYDRIRKEEKRQKQKKRLTE